MSNPIRGRKQGPKAGKVPAVPWHPHRRTRRTTGTCGPGSKENLGEAERPTRVQPSLNQIAKRKSCNCEIPGGLPVLLNCAHARSPVVPRQEKISRLRRSPIILGGVTLPGAKQFLKSPWISSDIVFAPHAGISFDKEPTVPFVREGSARTHPRRSWHPQPPFQRQHPRLQM